MFSFAFRLRTFRETKIAFPPFIFSPPPTVADNARGFRGVILFRGKNISAQSRIVLGYATFGFVIGDNISTASRQIHSGTVIAHDFVNSSGVLYSRINTGENSVRFFFFNKRVRSSLRY